MFKLLNNFKMTGIFGSHQDRVIYEDLWQGRLFGEKSREYLQQLVKEISLLIRVIFKKYLSSVLNLLLTLSSSFWRQDKDFWWLSQNYMAGIPSTDKLPFWLVCCLSWFFWARPLTVVGFLAAHGVFQWQKYMVGVS